ncbi:MAG: AarF/ABC1/UbiB kinase family protein [Candidatus Pacebacteria bacterium]|nr:AarF/ABC1/UbiB kinase family protein [Candidatus Paceibacterota bacterium]
MAKIKETYKNLKRSREIVKVLVRHGLGYIFDQPQMEKYLEISNRFFLRKKEETKLERFTFEERVRMALEELGPTFIKLGQVLSTHPDLASPELIEELSKLQDRITTLPAEIIKKQIERELKSPVKELFLSFNDKPLAAASLSQVHKAKLKSGEVVAVKVQRPGIVAVVEKDISILYELVDLLEGKWFKGVSYSPKEFVDEFAETIREELDFSLEAKNAEKFASNFEGSTTVNIPKVYREFTSKKVLVTDFIAGTKISLLSRFKGEDFDKHAIAANGMDMALKQIFDDGFFHGDLHPGNVFVLPGNVIALIDFGMVGRIDRDTMDELSDVLMSLTKFDAEGIVRGLEKMDIIGPDVDTKKIKREINLLIDRYYGLDLRELEVGKILTDVMEVIRKNNIRIPSEFALLFKTLITAEGTARSLDPEFNVVEHIQPFVRNLIRKKYSPDRIIKGGAGFLENSMGMIKKIPDNVDWLFKSLKAGKLYIGLEHRGLEKMDATIDRASNRLSFSLIISSMIIGSSFVMSMDKGPFIFGYSAFGIVGFIFAAVLGVGLVISIIRGGRF